MKTPNAKELPRHKSYPRYVQCGQAITDCKKDSRGRAVKLSTGCWISTQRWNEIANFSDDIRTAMKTALTEAHAARAVGKAEYAQICRQLDAMDNAGFESRRTALAVHAAEIAQCAK
jgi:hypothetical protein